MNWFGLETPNYAPHGLWQRPMGAMLDQIKSLGFNVLRVPFCSQLFDAGSTPNGIDLAQNPDLAGKTGAEILDALVAAAGQRGLRVILDRHRPDSGGQSALWYTAAYSEDRWIQEATRNTDVSGWPDGEHPCEALGPRIQGNPLALTQHLCVPFNLEVPVYVDVPRDYAALRTYLAALESRLPEAYTVDVALKLPLPLPSTVAFTATPAWTFALNGARNGRPHLIGTIS